MARNTFQRALEEAMASSQVQAAVRNRANRMLPRAQRTAFDAGAAEFGKSLRVETGVRPGAKSRTGLRRPYARIVAEVDEDMDAKDAGAKLSRRQILRRSARA